MYQPANTQQENFEEHFLASHFPGSTFEERRRFLISRNGDVDAASKMLVNYFNFRAEHLDSIQPIVHMNDVKQRGRIDTTAGRVTHASSPISSSTSSSRQQPPHLPQVVYMNNGPPLARDGTRIFYVMPCIINLALASAHDYAIQLASYLDHILCRHSMEKITVLIDIRSGLGWPNASPMKLLSFIKTASKILNDHFPERLSRCILYPMPRSTLTIWNTVKRFIDPKTVQKIILLPGSAGHDASYPRGLLNYVDEGSMAFLEHYRHSKFLT
eukprot:CAMPEP_0195513160 /NCGR_PEP_ID=MMETSP0794_2-20130614/4868_1 /TAXON_ID=515487 /ORGANISM="Stephanopyxis turris, Strain CCMP 815" /LENGTH=270 /DNA_ID=CAMNT_0040641097 /DNA_START=436 /DNA_END=1248 /DNA_ORIENTATION=-